MSQKAGATAKRMKNNERGRHLWKSQKSAVSIRASHQENSVLDLRTDRIMTQVPFFFSPKPDECIHIITSAPELFPCKEVLFIDASW